MPSTPLEARSPQSSEQPQQPSPQPPQPTSGSVAPRAPAHSNAGHIVEGVLISPEVTRYVQNVLADPQYDWKQPINFYGKAWMKTTSPSRVHPWILSGLICHQTARRNTTQPAIQQGYLR